MVDVTITTNYEHLINAVNAYLIANNIQHDKGKSFLDVIVYFDSAEDVFNFSNNCLKFVREHCVAGAYRFSIEILENGSFCLDLIDCWDY